MADVSLMHVTFRNQRCERPILARSHLRSFLHASPFQWFYGNTTSYFSFQSALFEPLASYTSMEVVVGNCEQKTWGSSSSFRWVVPSFEPRTFGGREIRMVRITLETGPVGQKPSRSAALTQPDNENLVQMESIFGKNLRRKNAGEKKGRKPIFWVFVGC